MIMLPRRSYRGLWLVSISLSIFDCAECAKMAASVQQITYGPKNHFFGYQPVEERWLLLVIRCRLV